MFIVMSLHTANFPFAGNEFRLREMLKDFVVPSLIVTEGGQDDAARRATDSGPTVERLFGRDG